MGLEEALILLYLLVDDAYRRVTFGGRLRQRGPEPKLSDVEVLTMEIFGEQQGRHDDAAIHRYFDGHWRHFFPELGSYQAFARQCAALSVIKQRILDLVFPASDTIQFSTASRSRSVAPAAATDAGPFGAWPRGATARPRRSISTACAAIWSSSGGHGGGLHSDRRQHRRTRRGSQPLRQDPGPADRRQGLHFRGLKPEAAAHDIDLQTPLRKNMPDDRDPGAVARLMRTRRAVETAIGKLSEMFAAQTTKARDLPGFVNRMARKLLAYNFSLMAAQS